MQYSNKRAAAAAVGTTAAVMAGNAAAAGSGISFDVSTAVAGMVALGVGIAALGLAKMSPAAIAVGWKWLKATVFG